MLGCYAQDSVSFIHLCDFWSCIQETRVKTHLQVRLLCKKCGNAFPSQYTPGCFCVGTRFHLSTPLAAFVWERVPISVHPWLLLISATKALFVTSLPPGFYWVDIKSRGKHVSEEKQPVLCQQAVVVTSVSCLPARKSCIWRTRQRVHCNIDTSKPKVQSKCNPCRPVTKSWQWHHQQTTNKIQIFFSRRLSTLCRKWFWGKLFLYKIQYVKRHAS